MMKMNQKIKRIKNFKRHVFKAKKIKRNILIRQNINKILRKKSYTEEKNTSTTTSTKKKNKKIKTRTRHGTTSKDKKH